MNVEPEHYRLVVFSEASAAQRDRRLVLVVGAEIGQHDSWRPDVFLQVYAKQACGLRVTDLTCIPSCTDVCLRLAGSHKGEQRQEEQEP